MSLWPSIPSESDSSLNEIFRHPRYRDATPADKRRIMLESAEWRYRYDTEMPFFDIYFPGLDPAPYLTDKNVLDFGCFTGGRALRWAEKYRIRKLFGTDINPIYLEAAALFAESRGVPCEYQILDDQKCIPFPNSSIDTVISFDVFEHVDDLERTLRECVRVLRPGGSIFVVFPSFYNPLESHLGLVTRVPAMQWLFAPEAITEAYVSILKERGQEAHWYAPRALSPWERLPTLNGTTKRQFYALVNRMPLEVARTTRTPIFVTGKSYRAIRRAFIRPILNVLLATRMFDDLLLDRIAVVLRRL